ncbi:MAG: V-type ATPase 116kDa subunit family protein [Methanomicrobiales archaeon]
MIQKMKSVLVVGPKSDFSQIVDLLYHTGTIHLEEVSEYLGSGSGNIRKVVTGSMTDIPALIASIDGILLLLPANKGGSDRTAHLYDEIYHLSTPDVLARAGHVVAVVGETTKNLSAKKSDLEITITGLNRYEKIIDKIQPLEQQLPILHGYEVTVLVIQKEYEDVLDIIRPALSDITNNQFELISADLDEQTIAVITVFNKHYSENVHRFLFSKNINEVRIPADYSNMPLDKALLLIDKNRRDAEYEKENIGKELAVVAQEWYPELAALHQVLTERGEELSAYNNFGETDYTVMIRGWIPKKFIQKTRDALNVTFHGRVVMTETEATAGMMGRAPIFYDNPRWVRPFEFLMKLASPPQYNEIDPSPLLAIFFPIFFGLIVGDIGYGILILLAGLFIRFRFEATTWLRQISGILIISSFPAIFFGFLFGEFFGNFGEMMGWIEPITLFGVTWNRIEAMIPLLILTIAIGVFHVVLGLVIGVINSITRKNRRHTCEKCGMIGVIAGLILLFALILGLLPGSLLIPAFILIGIAVALVIYGGGTGGAIEIMGTVGNILSYARLMAIGMASVILAMVANELGGSMDVLAVGILIAVLLHTLNLILAMFSPSIHSVRLHVVEFYSKFYQGGGLPYRPFSSGDKTGMSYGKK